MVQHSELNTNITKKVLRMLQFSYVRFIPFPTKSSERSKYPLAVSTETVFQTWTIKERFNTVSWMQASRRRLWECYCLVFIGSYFLCYHGPQCGPCLHLQILQKESFQTALSKRMFNSETWMQSSQSSFWECFYLVSTGRYFLFHHRPQSPPNVHLQILEKECFKASLSKGKFNSVSWMQTSQRSFWECFCLAFLWRLSRFQRNLQSGPNIHLQIPQKECLETAVSKGTFNSVSWMQSSQRSFCESYCLDFMWRYISFERRPQSGPNIHLQIQQKECFKPELSKEGSTLGFECKHHKEVSENASV